MFDIFESNKYDNKIAVINGGKEYTFSDLKKIIAYFIETLKNKKQDIVISTDNNFSFIIQFLASVFSFKNIHILSDIKKLNELDFDFDTIDTTNLNTIENYNFPTVDIKKATIYLHTSGSTGKSKPIKKTLENFILEAKDIIEEFNFKNKNYTVLSTTTMCHMFGITFHFFTPLISKSLIINTDKIGYPENVDYDNAILVTTPGFLNTVFKYNINFKKTPKYIITAGSKLDNEIFKHLEKNSKIIEIYGSTETGVIANKKHYDNDLTLFKNVNIKVNNDNVEVISKYVYNNNIIINDEIEHTGRNLKIKKRTDRLYKINEKRISAEELENKLKTNSFVNNCYIIKLENKLACLCALNDDGQEYLIKNNVASLTKSLKKHLFQYSEIVPQKWKYIDEIPMTQTGKINKKLIEHMFLVNLSLPIILKRTVAQDTITYKIFFYELCNFFKGHFPNYNIVPGVVQLFLAKEFANARYNLELGAGQWKRIKFSNIIMANSIIDLKLEKTEKNVSFEYYDESKNYSSGTFLCENIFEKALALEGR